MWFDSKCKNGDDGDVVYGAWVVRCGERGVTCGSTKNGLPGGSNDRYAGDVEDMQMIEVPNLAEEVVVHDDGRSGCSEDSFNGGI